MSAPTPQPATSSRAHTQVMASTAVFAVLWVMARASVQSISIDEADSFLAYAVRPTPSGWESFANNHVLNSLLMRLVVYIFGASAFTIRVPALIGSALYISAVYFLVRVVSGRLLVQWSLFVCMVYSPFVMDYLVPGRGYSLAMGFLMAAIALACYRPKSFHWNAAMISMCAGLSFSANFAFAIVDAAAVALMFLWIARRPEGGYLKAIAAFVLPGVAVAYFFTGSVVLGWSTDQFTWGAHSWPEAGRSFLQASLYEPNPYLLNPRLLHYFVHFGTLLFPILGGFLLLRLAALGLERKAWKGTTAALGAIAGGSLLIAFLGHWLMHAAWHILLPQDRTGLYIVPLFFALVGAAAALPMASRWARVAGQGVVAMLFLLACYDISCLRLTYFKEWKFDSDMKKVYGVLAYYNHTYGVRDVSVNWRYVAALNAYREISGRETLNAMPPGPPEVNEYPPGFPMYVVLYHVDYDFVNREHLKLVYRDEFSDVAVAVRGEVEGK